jgi:phosphonoacetaldehyde hydrolase
MKQIEAVIFDWAGTTVDYGCMAPMHAMKQAFSEEKIDVTLDQIRQPMGLLKVDHIHAVLKMDKVKSSFEQCYGRLPCTNDVEKIYQHFEKNIMSTLSQHTRIIEGILEVQDDLRQHHIKIGSTTGYTAGMIALVADAAKKQGYHPDFVISADKVQRGRPYPYMIYQNIMALDVQDIRSVVKVGDTLVDMLEAKYAGCWSVGVIKGSSMLGLTEEEVDALSNAELTLKMKEVKYQMLASGADYVIDTLAELPWAIACIQERIQSIGK